MFLFVQQVTGSKDNKDHQPVSVSDTNLDKLIPVGDEQSHSKDRLK